jgi:glutamate-1-semialdehyde 2,1-aminomutase
VGSGARLTAGRPGRPTRGEAEPVRPDLTRGEAPGEPVRPPRATAARADGAGRSAALYERALRLLPGGVNSPVRAMRAIGRDPVFVARGEGAELVDVDGRRYVDWMMSWGPLVAGHAHPEVVAAVTAAATAGTSYGAPTEAEVELAEAVVERVPSVEMVRMTSSGTEASMSALRLARAATGRDAVVKFAGAYHGHVDGLLAEAGSGLATQGIPASPGVTRAQAADTIVVRWNDRGAVERALAEHEPAAILCEPYPANMGLVPPAAGFLRFLREAADAAGALLVFDEVISGFRVARGGAQEREGVLPDLTILGKVLGGGLPAAALAGPRDLMERVAPAGDVYQAGTLSGNPLATAAGLATLRLLDGAAYQRLERTAAALAGGLRAAASEAGVPVQVAQVTGLLTPFMSATPVADYEGARACDLERHAAFCRAMLARGVLLPPSQFEAWFPSLAHTDAHVELTVAAAREALRELA